MLKKNISLLSGIAIAISMVIGSGLFGLPGLAVAITDPITALCGWLLVIIIMPAIIYIFSFLGQKYPSSTGIALYASLGFGRWSENGILLIACGTLLVGMPAFFIVGGSYITSLLGFDALYTIPAAISLALITTIINLLGVDKLQKINKITVLLILLIIGYIAYHSAIKMFPTIKKEYFDIKNLSSIKTTKVWLAAAIVFWAFQGWENMTFGFGEIKNPEKNIPIIFWVSFLFVSIVYIIFSFSISIAAIDGINVNGLNGLIALLPNTILGKALLLLMVLILIANASSWVFGCSRLFLSSAQAGVLPKFLSYVDKKGVPVVSLLVALLSYIVIMIFIFIFDVKIQFIFLLTTQGFIVLYGGAILAFIKKRQGLISIIIALWGIFGWLFLIQGFYFMLLYPLLLFIIGLCINRKTLSI